MKLDNQKFASPEPWLKRHYNRGYRAPIVAAIVVPAVCMVLCGQPWSAHAVKAETPPRPVVQSQSESNKVFVDFGRAWLNKLESGDFGSAYDDFAIEIKHLITRDQFIARASQDAKSGGTSSLPSATYRVVGSKGRVRSDSRGGWAYGILLVNVVTPYPDTKDGKKVTVTEPATVMVRRLPSMKWTVGQFTNLPGSEVIALETLIALFNAQIEQQKKQVRQNVEK